MVNFKVGEEMRFNSCRVLRFFSSSRVRDILITSLLISSPSLELTIFLHFITHMAISTLLILAARRTHMIHESCIWPICHESFVLQWSEHPTGRRKVIVSIPLGDSDFFHRPVLVTCWSLPSFRRLLCRLLQFSFENLSPLNGKVKWLKSLKYVKIP